MSKISVAVKMNLDGVALRMSLEDKQGKKFISVHHLMSLLGQMKTSDMLEVDLSPNGPPDPGVK